MENSLSYFKNLNISELIDIISNVWGFEETSEALLQLEKKDPQKALELGIEILECDKGDDYLQASVWNIIFSLYPEKVLNSLEKRNKTLGKVLLYDILKELNSKFYIKDVKTLSQKIISKIFEDYNTLPQNVNDEIHREFIEFTKNLRNNSVI